MVRATLLFLSNGLFLTVDDTGGSAGVQQAGSRVVTQWRRVKENSLSVKTNDLEKWKTELCLSDTFDDVISTAAATGALGSGTASPALHGGVAVYFFLFQRCVSIRNIVNKIIIINSDLTGGQSCN